MPGLNWMDFDAPGKLQYRPPERAGHCGVALSVWRRGGLRLAAWRSPSGGVALWPVAAGDPQRI